MLFLVSKSELPPKLRVFYSSYRAVTHGVCTNLELEGEACQEEITKTIDRK